MIRRRWRIWYNGSIQHSGKGGFSFLNVDGDKASHVLRTVVSGGSTHGCGGPEEAEDTLVADLLIMVHKQVAAVLTSLEDMVE